MWKLAFAGAAAVAIVGSSLVYAQERPRPGFERSRASIEDMRLFAEARLAALHAGLGLTADQEKNWPAFEQAAHDLAKLRVDRFSQARDRGPQSFDPGDRMHERAAAMTETGAALQKLADATDPLFKSLTDSQKRRFAILERMLAPRPGGFDFRDRDGFRRDGNGPRRGEFPPRRTDFTPQGGERSL
jgi:zinc resistance-associated protein